MQAIDYKKEGAIIAEKRKQKNLTQKELAKILFVSDKAISRWETGEQLNGFESNLQQFSENLNIFELVDSDLHNAKEGLLAKAFFDTIDNVF